MIFSASRIRDAIIHFELISGETQERAIKWSDHFRDCQKHMRDGGHDAYDIDHMRGARMAEVCLNGMTAEERALSLSDTELQLQLGLVRKIMDQDRELLASPMMADDWL